MVVLCPVRNKVMYLLSPRTVYALTQVVLWGLTVSRVHNQFATQVHRLLYTDYTLNSHKIPIHKIPHTQDTPYTRHTMHLTHSNCMGVCCEYFGGNGPCHNGYLLSLRFWSRGSAPCLTCQFALVSATSSIIYTQDCFHKLAHRPILLASFHWQLKFNKINLLL